MITLNIFTIINLIALSLLMGIRKVNTRANKLLAAIIVLPASAFFINYLIFTDVIETVPFILGFNLSFIWAPFVCWYVKLMLKQEVRISFKKGWHLIPLLLDISYGIFVQFQSVAYQANIIHNLKQDVFPWQIVMLNSLMLFQILMYLGYSAYLIFKYQDDGKEREQTLKVNWLKQFIIILITLNIILILSYFFLSPVEVDYWVVPILYNIFYFWVVYKSFSSSGIFSDFTYNINIKEEISSKGKYSGSALTETQIANYREALLMLFNEHEPFKNPELTLNKLSIDAGIPQHYLSQVINQEFKKNFFDFINSYRIDNAKKLMKDPATGNLTLEAIGAESGFGSPTAFYRAFKKHTGITPSRYLKSDVTI